MALSGRVNETLFKLLEVNFIKHRKAVAIDESLKKNILVAYVLTNRGSKMLYDCLKDPNIEIPSIDNTTRPKMDKLPSNQGRDSNKLIGH